MKLLIALPCYQTGTGVAGRAITRVYTTHPDWQITVVEGIGSLLTAGFNRLWAHALNLRERGEITHFLMLHSDILPRNEDWVGDLLAEMEKADVQVLSAIVPIKDKRGLTSTALDTHEWRPMRFTMGQVHAMSVTWTDERILFNTGMMLVDFSGDWVERVAFTVGDMIARVNGVWESYVEPEDWHFSRQCRALGVRVAVTRAVKLEHYGQNFWPNDKIWGDTADFQNAPFVTRTVTPDARPSEETPPKLTVVK